MRFAMLHLAQNETYRNHRTLPSGRIATHRRRVIRILFVDDMESDVERCLQELKHMDFAVCADWVQVPAEFAERLHTQSYAPPPTWTAPTRTPTVSCLVHDSPIPTGLRLTPSPPNGGATRY